jgi:23S rRNA (uracil1939-C5)-methyltransferase
MAIEVVIEKIVYPGKRLAYLGGKTIFADEGLPGETIEIRPVAERKTFIEAETIRIVKESPDRIRVRCSHYKACSPYQSMTYESELRIKAEQLHEIFAARIPALSGNITIVPSPEVWHSRNRVRLRLVWEGSRPRWAYNLPSSQKKFVPIETCFLVPHKSTQLLEKLLEIVRECGLRDLREAEVRESRSRGLLLLSLFWGAARAPRSLDRILSGLVPHFPMAGVVSYLKAGARLRMIPDWGSPFVEEEAAGVTFQVGAGSFFQVNMCLLDRVISDMKDFGMFKGEELLADLYSGVGTFGIALARAAKEVYAVESDAENVAYLRKNTELNRTPNVEVFEGPTEEWLPWILEKKIDAAIIDPPRRGLESEAVRNLVEKPVTRLLYLSCNPTTLARDLGKLERSYGLVHVQAYDFFPRTPHIEVLAVLKKR